MTADTAWYLGLRRQDVVPGAILAGGPARLDIAGRPARRGVEHPLARTAPRSSLFPAEAAVRFARTSAH